MKDHNCAKPHCSLMVPGYMLACHAHWAELPPPLRSRISAAWPRRRKEGSDEAVSAHLATVLEAMDLWLADEPIIQAVRVIE